MRKSVKNNRAVHQKHQCMTQSLRQSMLEIILSSCIIIIIYRVFTSLSYCDFKGYWDVSNMAQKTTKIKNIHIQCLSISLQERPISRLISCRHRPQIPTVDNLRVQWRISNICNFHFNDEFPISPFGWFSF